MTRPVRLLRVGLIAALALVFAAPAPRLRADDDEAGAPIPFAEARIFIEYNFTDNDLGFHVFLDGEDWRQLRIVDPRGRTIFDVQGKGGYRALGLTELFFEGAEPTLDEFPLDDLLALFPEGEYRFLGMTVDGTRLESRATLTHDVPAGPEVFAEVKDDGTVVISWEPVTGPAAILPDREVDIVGYQVIVGSFQVTLPESSTQVTLPREFVESLEPGEHDFEVLAIEEGDNQTIASSALEIE